MSLSLPLSLSPEVVPLSPEVVPLSSEVVPLSPEVVPLSLPPEVAVVVSAADITAPVPLQVPPQVPLQVPPQLAVPSAIVTPMLDSSVLPPPTLSLPPALPLPPTLSLPPMLSLPVLPSNIATGGNNDGPYVPLRVLCIGDPHFKVSNARESDEMCARVYERLDSMNVDIIVVLGDVLDRHETIHVEPLIRATTFLKTLSERKPTYVLIGNHDRPNNSDFCSNKHPFAALHHWSNITVIDTPKCVTVQGYKFVLAPYVPPGRFEECLMRLCPDAIAATVTTTNYSNNDGSTESVATTPVPSVDTSNSAHTDTTNTTGTPNTESSINATVVASDRMPTFSWNHPVFAGTACVFAHQEFKGAKMGAIVSEIGDEWPLQYPLCMSGHIHDFDELQSNMIYAGTPMQHGFGDSAAKTVSILTFRPNGSHEHERVDLQLTKRIIVHLKPDQVHGFVPDKTKLTKIVISATSGEIKALSKLESLKRLQKEGVKISYKHLPDDPAAQEAMEVAASVRMSYMERLYSEIQEDPGQKKWFEQLFGRVDTVEVVA